MYYTLSFDYKFEHAEDEVWFAHAVPYTYSDMQNMVKGHLDRPETQSYLRADILCNSLGGMPVPLLTITENVKTCMHYKEQLALQNDVPSLIRKAFK